METVDQLKSQILESNELSTTLMIKTIITEFCAKLINAALSAIPNDSDSDAKTSFSKNILVAALQNVFNEQSEENKQLYDKLCELISTNKKASE